MVLFKMKFYLLFAIQLIVYAEIGKILVQGHQQFGQLKGSNQLYLENAYNNHDQQEKQEQLRTTYSTSNSAGTESTISMMPTFEPQTFDINELKQLKKSPQSSSVNSHPAEVSAKNTEGPVLFGISNQQQLGNLIQSKEGISFIPVAGESANELKHNNPIKGETHADDSSTSFHRPRRSYNLPGMDLSQFYTPAGLTGSAEGAEQMTENEVDVEREKFLRLLAILSSASKSQAAAAGDSTQSFATDGSDYSLNEDNFIDDNSDEPPIDLGYYGSYNPITGEKYKHSRKGSRTGGSGKSAFASTNGNAVAREPVINLMSSHPKNNGKSNFNSAESGWIEDPIPLHRHRIARRTSYPAGASSHLFRMLRSNRNNIFDGFGNFYGVENPNKGLLNDNNSQQFYSLNELFSPSSQAKDPRFPVIHQRYLL